MLSKFLVGITIVWMSSLWIFSGLMHFWTIYIAYENSGWFWGIITLFFPVIAQMVWGYNAYVSSGFDSPYIQWLIVLVVAWILNFIFQFIIGILENRENNKLLIAASAEVVIDQSPILYGFGGWLYFVAVGLLVAFGQSLFYLVDELFPIYATGQLKIISQQSPLLALAVLYETIFNIYVIVITLLAAYLCFKLKKSFKRTMIVFYSLNFILTGLYVLVVHIVPEIDQAMIKAQINALVRGAVTVAIWVPYFVKSKRVKNTYIN